MDHITKEKVEQEVSQLRADPETYLKNRKAKLYWWVLPIIFGVGFVAGLIAPW